VVLVELQGQTFHTELMVLETISAPLATLHSVMNWLICLGVNILRTLEVPAIGHMAMGILYNHQGLKITKDIAP
jgi:hypothetical protein